MQRSDSVSDSTLTARNALRLFRRVDIFWKFMIHFQNESDRARGILKEIFAPGQHLADTIDGLKDVRCVCKNNDFMHK
jgi:hypothetical protein